MTKPSEPERWRYASPESPNTTSLSSQSHTSEVTQGKTNEGQPEKIGVPGFVSISPKNSLGTDTGSVDPSTSRVTLATYYLMGLYASYSHYKDLIFNYLDRSRSFVIPRPLLFELFSTLYDDMKVEVDLHSRLTQNTRRPLPPISASTTVEEFCGWFRGANIRWELLGVVFALAGLASVHTAEPEKPLSYESFATDMYTASRVCIEICEEDNQMNDMTTWMRHTNVALASNLFGDTSSSLTAELFALRYHRQISLQSGVPFFMSETRKRLFAAAVCRDMNLATLLERPPFIDCNFCDMTYPLDLDEEEVVLVGSELNAALQHLDENGWKVSSEREKLLRPATGIRIRFLLSILRAKVLRLSLGNRMESMTKKYSYVNAVAMNWSCVVLLSAHLDHLHCGFQILRMLQQEGQDTLTTILDTSMGLLSGMLDLMKQQERFVELRERFTWIVISRLLDDTLNQGLTSAKNTNSHLEKVQQEQQVPEGFHMDESSDASDKLQPLPEPFTSEEFLSWIDDLVWDGQTNISMGF
ncbi:unnamed protein product [Aspergillus oryzae]|uniref:Unnamed protein product n=2 Tax=Aspergillus oryzae TaxID=5062 RepID=A0AAN5BTB3_ASPOZ|nr:unnamed protein product [Aspergillus oryzae]GMF84426.1 unnamed protein product [Aspergillus oryzae]GMG05405.1 unnamed protein product [Aspergillus oryzae]GMG23831.1 unnamed protein product [Aspergillus oryzae]GMG44325.1 unnamed protein product [Aspergillus oryzae var. brunneus]